MGGLPVDVGWSGLRLFETDVLPRLVESGRGPTRPIASAS